MEKGADFVLIHDGARPLISVEVINKAIENVKKTFVGSADREGGHHDRQLCVGA